MDKITKKYSLKEISKRTHISPLSLKRLLNYEFETISEIKFNGFLKILENEFSDYDFKELKSRANEFYSSKHLEQTTEETINHTNNNFKVYLIVIVLIVSIGFLINYMQHLQTQKVKASNDISIVETNLTKIVQDLNETTPNEIVVEEKIEDKNISPEVSSFFNEKDKNMTLVIVPKQRVWFRVTYLDTNKSKNYIQAVPEEFNGSRDIYIEFGHGMETLIFNDKNVSPNSVEKVNFILKDGELNITTLPKSEFYK